MGGDATVSIVVPQALAADASVAWAARELQAALGRRSIAARIGPEAGSATVVEVAGAGASAPFGSNLPEAAEAMALLREGGRILAWGHDRRGIVYALTELADRVAHAADDDVFVGTFPLDRAAFGAHPLDGAPVLQRGGGQGLVPRPPAVARLPGACWPRTGSTGSR